MPEIPDFKNNIADLGGDLREHSHQLLRDAFKDGQMEFDRMIADELATCSAHFDSLIGHVTPQLDAQRQAAGNHRDLLAAGQKEILFNENGASLVTLKHSRPILALGWGTPADKGADANYFVGSDGSNNLRIFVDERKDSIVGFNSYPDTDTQISLSDHLHTNEEILYWQGNVLNRWLGHGKHAEVLRGNFNTGKGAIRQSLDVENQRLAFAAGNEVHVLDLTRFWGLRPASKQEVIVSHLASSQVGGVALWESQATAYWFHTQPATGEIYFGSGPDRVGLSVGHLPNARQDLKTPLVNGDQFTLEFWYQLPTTLPADAMIPLIGGLGYPSLSLDVRTMGLDFVWEFPDYPELPRVAGRVARNMEGKAGEWMHIAMTNDNGVLAFYHNGKHLFFLHADGATPLPILDEGMSLGNFGSSHPIVHQHGAFAELRTWSRPLSAAEIAHNMGHWVVATEQGWPTDLVLYHRFWGPGLLRFDAAGKPAIATGIDLARPTEQFDILAAKEYELPADGPFRSPLLFWKTQNELGPWVATDAQTGLVTWSERFPDGQWYLMEAPASGHLPPQRLRKIEAWEIALVRTKNVLAGDILATTLLELLGLYRHAHQAQLRALHLAQVRGNLAYRRLFAALDAAAAHRDEDTTRAAHPQAMNKWIAAKNKALDGHLLSKMEQHTTNKTALLKALSDVRDAHASAIQIRKAAQLTNLNNRRT